MRHVAVRLSALVVIAALSGCQDRSAESEPVAPAPSLVTVDGDESMLGSNSSVTWKPLSGVAREDGGRFQRLDVQETGVDFVIPLDTKHRLKRLYASGFFCGGVAIGDVNDDGRPDIFVVSGPGDNGLYLQVGDFRFENVTDRAGVGGGDAWGTGVAMADVDNDGDLDLYVCNYDSPNRLYINQGQNGFVESARTFGLDITDCCLLPTFCDYDRDGDLDCYLLMNRYYRDGGLPRDIKLVMRNGQLSLFPKEYEKYYGIIRTGQRTGYLQRVGRPDRLLRNNGDGTFTDVSRAAGISRASGHGLSATWWDYDNDGWYDLYVGNDFNDADHLYRNHGDGTFTDVIEQRIPHTTWFSMGADAGDVNNDGWVDFLSTDMLATTHFGRQTTTGTMDGLYKQTEMLRPPQYMRNALYLNTGTTRFMEVAYLGGLARTDWTWSVRLADLDNDGRTDVYFTNGITRNMIDSDVPFKRGAQMGGTMWDHYEKLPVMRQQNLAYRNEGDLRFRDVSKAWGLDHVGMSFAAAVGDLDRDGDLDLVVTNLDEPVSIYRNGVSTGHRVLLRLRGTSSNRWGVGAEVRIETAAGQQVRQLIPTGGYLSSNEPLVHFGLGSSTSIPKLHVQWPTGHRQTITELPADRFYTITEETSSTPNVAASGPEPTLYRRSKALANHRHVEMPFDDFADRPLLPNKLSQLGPGLALSDVDGDGDDDLFLSGGAGQSGTLYRNQGAGQFSLVTDGPFDVDAACEDMAPLFFDSDGDGDMDLYVVSGGVECEPEGPRLRDRLYLNDGDGLFAKAPPGTIPDLRDSGGTAAACDFDRDGDLDLFVGGRVLPGQYPMPPDSRLLRNDDGRLVDVTRRLAPELGRTGMVTGAVWSDTNDDGWCDLLVTHEWGPVKLFQNRQGRLVDQTEAAGLDQRLGWWNGIAGRDLDADGDVDYVVTNFGLNSKYHATPESPTLLYYGDFEGASRLRLVEATFEGKHLFPVRGKDDSTKAMPFLGAKFPTYKSFAAASLDEIYSPERLQSAERLAATTLSSGVLINDGNGRMEFRPLPNLAQVSPGFGLVLTETDGDGHADLYFVQNSFSPHRVTGRMDGGLSWLCLGNGDGTFRPVWPARSGLVVSGDAKGLVSTDLNQDGWPDFLVGINNGRPLAFLHQGHKNRQVLNVRLEGPPGNPTAIGARVTLRFADGKTQTAEVVAGSGYLSQSTAALTFGWHAEDQHAEIKVRWPDATSSVHPATATQATIAVKYPQPKNGA